MKKKKQCPQTSFVAFIETMFKFPLKYFACQKLFSMKKTQFPMKILIQSSHKDIEVSGTVRRV